MVSKVVVCYGKNTRERTFECLKKLNPEITKSKVLIKPNLVEVMPNESGAITRKEFVEGIIEFLHSREIEEIFVGEGAGGTFNTFECFEEAGYLELEEKYGIKLVDLNKGSFKKIKGDFWEFKVNKICLDCYLISAAVLKEHAYEVTLSMKNMMGILKPWNKLPTKGYMHKEEDYKIWSLRLIDLIKHVKPNLALIDATTGMLGSHLTGRLKRFDCTIASEDCVACDIVGARLLGYKKVYYIDLALKHKLGSLPKIVEFKVG